MAFDGVTPHPLQLRGDIPDQRSEQACGYQAAQPAAWSSTGCHDAGQVSAGQKSRLEASPSEPSYLLSTTKSMISGSWSSLLLGAATLGPISGTSQLSLDWTECSTTLPLVISSRPPLSMASRGQPLTTPPYSRPFPLKSQSPTLSGLKTLGC